MIDAQIIPVRKPYFTVREKTYDLGQHIARNTTIPSQTDPSMKITCQAENIVPHALTIQIFSQGTPLVDSYNWFKPIAKVLN